MPIDATSVFGAAAVDYDALRPDYPVTAVGPILARTEAAGPAVDIACGTGKFAAVLTGLGLEVDGVEPDARMAAMAARRAGIPIHRSTFEAWRPTRRYGVLTCAQAWHWLDPRLRAAKARSCLRPGGVAVLAWNLPRDQDAVDDELAPVHAAVLPEGWDEAARQAERDRPLDVDRVADELAEHGFGPVTRDEVAWRRSYSPRQWCRLLGTQSRYRVLPPDQRARLFQAIEQHLARRADRTVTLRYDCVLLSAQRLAGAG